MVKDSEKGKYTSPEGSSTWEYLATASCSLMIFCCGSITGWTLPSLGILMGPDTPIPITPSSASTLASMVAMGHALAPIFTSLMADKLGRKNSLVATGVPTIICWILTAYARHIMVLYVARFMGGLTLGFIFCFPQMYLGEIASAKLRGRLGMVCGTMLNTGLFFMFAVGPYLSVSTMANVCLSISVVTTICIWFIPESPYFLAMIGKLDEAEVALQKLRGKAVVTEELELIEMTVSKKDQPPKGTESSISGESISIRKLFSVSANRKALAINLLIAGILQWGGFTSIMIYGDIIFKRMNTGMSTHLCTIVLGGLQPVCNILTAFVIDKIGRRPLICISGTVSGALMLNVGIYFYFLEHTDRDVSWYGIFALSSVIANGITLNFGIMPLHHVVQSETLATDIKSLATCVLGVGGGIMAIFGTKMYLMVSEAWGFGHAIPFLTFSLITWIGTGLILFLLPETKGKTLLQIQNDLNAR